MSTVRNLLKCCYYCCRIAMLPIVAVAAQLLLLRVASASVYDDQQGKQLLKLAHIERIFCFCCLFSFINFYFFMPCRIVYADYKVSVSSLFGVMKIFFLNSDPKNSYNLYIRYSPYSLHGLYFSDCLVCLSVACFGLFFSINFQFR